MPYGGPGVENIGRGNQKPEVEVVIIGLPVVVDAAGWRQQDAWYPVVI